LGLRVLILAMPAVSFGHELLSTVRDHGKSFQCARALPSFAANSGGNSNRRKASAARSRSRRSVPPWVFPARQPVHINVFRLHHFKQASFAVRAAPAARAAATVRASEIAKKLDRVIHHDSALRAGAWRSLRHAGIAGQTLAASANGESFARATPVSASLTFLSQDWPKVSS